MRTQLPSAHKCVVSFLLSDCPVYCVWAVLYLTGTRLKAAYKVVLVFSGCLFLFSVLRALPAGIAWSREIGFTTSMAVYSVNTIDPQPSSMAI